MTRSSRLEKLKKKKKVVNIINVGNLFILKKNKKIKDRIIRDIRNLFEHEEDHYKSLRVGNSWSNNYIEYESNSDSSKDNNEERVMYLKSDNKEIQINVKKDEVIEKFFRSLLSRHQTKLETPMRGSDFLFDCVHLLYYKDHNIKLRQGESYINSGDLIKSKKKAKINHTNKKDNECFQ